VSRKSKNLIGHKPDIPFRFIADQTKSIKYPLHLTAIFVFELSYKMKYYEFDNQTGAARTITDESSDRRETCLSGLFAFGKMRYYQFDNLRGLGRSNLPLFRQTFDSEKTDLYHVTKRYLVWSVFLFFGDRKEVKQKPHCECG
jgi:hypothetical protein